MRPSDTPPRLDNAAPFKAVVVVDADVTPEWQGRVSDWLGLEWLYEQIVKALEAQKEKDKPHIVRYAAGEASG